MLTKSILTATFVSGSTALLAVLLMAAGTAQAETSAWTGCVDPGGTIIHLARGDNPLVPCKRKHRLEHVWSNQIQDSHGALFVIPSA